MRCSLLNASLVALLGAWVANARPDDAIGRPANQGLAVSAHRIDIGSESDLPTPLPEYVTRPAHGRLLGPAAVASSTDRFVLYFRALPPDGRVEQISARSRPIYADSSTPDTRLRAS